MSSCGSSAAETGGKRGSELEAATAQRGTTFPSGSVASMWPMQPRRSPCLWIGHERPARTIQHVGRHRRRRRFRRDVRGDALARQAQEERAVACVGHAKS